MEIKRVGVDLAKNVFQLHGVDGHEKPVWKKSLRRGQWLQELQRRVAAGAQIGMEACAGAHHWGRQLRARGYQVKLMAPQFVKPYVKSNKWPASTISFFDDNQNFRFRGAHVRSKIGVA